MAIEQQSSWRFTSRGMVIPAVLVLLAGLWLIAIALLGLAAVSQRTARIEQDRLHAQLAVQAGLADALNALGQACSDDLYLVISDGVTGSGQAPRLHVASPSLRGGGIRYDFHPLFSHAGEMDGGMSLQIPPFESETDAVIALRSGRDPAHVDWLWLNNEGGDPEARYAYWIEDLEARVDPGQIGLESEGPVRLQAMDKSPMHQRVKQLLDQRELMVSPGSILAAAGIEPPLERWKRHENPVQAGQLRDPWAAFLEAHSALDVQPYEEQALVPYVPGVAPAVLGQPKLNLNALLSMEPNAAVEAMAEWIRAALPSFERRRGGFPDDYVETLAANALDYADHDQKPRIASDRYRGIDGQPFLSEVVLHLHFQGLVHEEERWVLKWSLSLFAELWNLGSQPIEKGEARLTYEVNLRPTPVGFGDAPLPFDAPELIDDPKQSDHQLVKVAETYLTPAIEVSLRPNEYRFYEFAKVDYRIECEPQLDAAGEVLAEWFDLVEMEHEARGLSLIWNGAEVERLQRIHRDPYGLTNFRTDRRRKTAKACIPALNYGGYGVMINNPGDPRISHYLRALPLGENAYPENVSPHRRNIRRRNIYDRDLSPDKARHYGRVMPSQWPDGGHDSPTGDFRVTTSDARMPTDQEFWPWSQVPTPIAAHAPQRISNRGRFRCASELGRVFDPLMWTPAYADLPDESGSGLRDTAILTGSISLWQRPAMPSRRNAWPEVSRSSLSSVVHGGGNSLRIGRPEHERFDQPGMRAAHLLDLFHCGHPDSDDSRELEGSTQKVRGRINLNTASHEVLRCLVYGALREDESIARILSHEHDTAYALGPQLEAWTATPSQLDATADRIADAIIRERPFTSLSEVARIRDENGAPVFGHPELFEADGSLQWSDAAAEELFARICEGAGLRSRNFRLWILGQRIRGRDGSYEVVSQSRRMVNVFVDPGERGARGELIPENQILRILHGRHF